jgi:murein DD-endopeptidase MepM/ murein hydrolase activator NlpD
LYKKIDIKKIICIVALFIAGTVCVEEYISLKPNAWEVYLGNTAIAYVKDKEDFNRINEKVKSQLMNEHKGMNINEEIKFQQVKIDYRLLSHEEFIKNSIKNKIKIEVPAVIMKADGKTIGYLNNQAEIVKVLDKVKDYYIKKNNIKQLEGYKLNNKITYVKVNADISKISTMDALSEKIILSDKNNEALVCFNVTGVKNGAELSRASQKVTLFTPALGTITSNFGMRWGKQHKGIDIGAAMGDPIYAAWDGKVIAAHYEEGYGNVIKIQHSNGIETVYGHCSLIEVHANEYVKKGDKIGRVGSTGNSTGPHLHFEVIVNGQPENPLKYLNTGV